MQEPVTASVNKTASIATATPVADDVDIQYSIDIKDLSKRFTRRTLSSRAGYTTLKSALLGIFGVRNKAQVQYTTAVKDLTVRVPRGSSVGIIGRNGSGKSSLLKLITGIYKPDAGSVLVEGRIAALIELGAGFHPDFTGRENLFLAGAMHGLSRAEVRRLIPDIVRFAELEDVIDDPVRTYSSGMFMRLGFSLAVHIEPEILIVDEVLAVGDAGFVAKCKDRISALRKAGKTLLLVSHDLDAVERWCDEVVWLDKGVVKDRGEPRRVIDRYRQFLEAGQEAELVALEQEMDDFQRADGGSPVEEKRWGSREIEITDVALRSGTGDSHRLFHPEDALHIEIAYARREALPDLVFGIAIHRNDGVLVHGTNTEIEKIKISELAEKGTVRYEIKRLALLEGAYSIDVAVHSAEGYPYDYRKEVVDFVVRSPIQHVGVFNPEHTWKIE